nr:hypothetical protein Cduv_308 [Cedratvirus duvanny]
MRVRILSSKIYFGTWGGLIVLNHLCSKRPLYQGHLANRESKDNLYQTIIPKRPLYREKLANQESKDTI